MGQRLAKAGRHSAESGRACTFVKTGEDTTGSCLIILTNKPYKHADVLKACVPNARDEKHWPKLCHVSVANKTAVHFATERILLIGNTDSVVRCLAQAARWPLGRRRSPRYRLSRPA